MQQPSTSWTSKQQNHDDLSKKANYTNIVQDQQDRDCVQSCRNFVEKEEGKESLRHWLSGNNKNKVLIFRLSAIFNTDKDDTMTENLCSEIDHEVITNIDHMPAKKLNMTYKSMQAEMKLLSKILKAHGLKEILAADDDNYNLLWTGVHLKPDILRAMNQYQRVNHFPRSYELTRKDRLFKNIQQMQHVRGMRHCDFIPQTYVLPGDINQMNSAYNRNRGPWIVKPIASSRGRGIYVVDNIDKIPKDEQLVVAKYITDPLLLNGHKCDLRLYVLVTSMDPLLVYLYEEGLVRLATVRYDSSVENLWNPCIHLCNYSINKHHTDYVKSEDPLADDIGHKRTLSALLRYLKSQGCDISALMSSIEELIIKSLLACCSSVVAACKMFQPYPANCFELFGFDILVDSSLKPWLLEVNLSPSLGIDTALDLRVKTSLVTDLLTLVGLPAVDMNAIKVHHSAFKDPNKTVLGNIHNKPPRDMLQNLAIEEKRIIKWVKSQNGRRGGFIRIFPTPESMQKYGQYLDPITGVPSRDLHGSEFVRVSMGRNYNKLLHRHLFSKTESLEAFAPCINERLARYERILKPLNIFQTVSGEAYYNALLNNDCRTWSPENHSKLQDIDGLSHILYNGAKLTKIEIRKILGQYILLVLRQFTTLSWDNYNCELILKFLQKAASILRTSTFIKLPPEDLSVKDRSAVIAKQLSDFLYQYNRETAALLSESNNEGLSIDEQLFDAFLLMSSEDELGKLLLQQTRIYENELNLNARSDNGVHIRTSFLRLLKAVPFVHGHRNDVSDNLVIEGVSTKTFIKNAAKC